MNVKEITDATKTPYNSVVAFAGGTSVVVGKNTIVTNKHIAKVMIFSKIKLSAHHLSKGKAEETTTLKTLMEYPGKKTLRWFMFMKQVQKV